MILSPVMVGISLESILFPQAGWDKQKGDQLIRYLGYAISPWKPDRTVCGGTPGYAIGYVV
ncbi:hypothetical protein AU476_11395 [Cupriavidus sp. UYMSc13B]|nr:hypothetical protein AU476_11395 [Cupriavidus sp. UYMSc13B]